MYGICAGATVLSVATLGALHQGRALSLLRQLTCQKRGALLHTSAAVPQHQPHSLCAAGCLEHIELCAADETVQQITTDAQGLLALSL